MRNDSVEDLVGETIVAIDGMAVGSDQIDFTTATGKVFRLYHSQDCCESVQVSDVNTVGSDDALIGSPVVSAAEESNSDNPPEHADSFTWTFYRISTARGTVTLRWLGESSGYYSESVDFVLLKGAAA